VAKRKNHDGGVLTLSDGRISQFMQIRVQVCVCAGISGSPERRWQMAEGREQDWREDGGREHERVGGSRERDDGKVARATQH
jgi:hypothetical protein